MRISEGEEAGEVWDAMIQSLLSEEEKKKAKHDLLAYCKQDTLAMARLLDLLRKV